MPQQRGRTSTYKSTAPLRYNKMFWRVSCRLALRKQRSQPRWQGKSRSSQCKRDDRGRCSTWLLGRSAKNSFLKWVEGTILIRRCWAELAQSPKYSAETQCVGHLRSHNRYRPLAVKSRVGTEPRTWHSVLQLNSVFSNR